LFLDEEELELHFAVVVDRGHRGGRRGADVVVTERDRELADDLHVLAVPARFDRDIDPLRHAVQGEVAGRVHLDRFAGGRFLRERDRWREGELRSGEAVRFDAELWIRKPRTPPSAFRWRRSADTGTSFTVG